MNPAKHDLISMGSLSRAEITALLTVTHEIAACDDQYGRSDSLRGVTLLTLFYTQSTRTRLSFEAAMLQLGGQVLTFTDTSPSPGRRRPIERVRDVARVIDTYADLSVIRHPSANAVNEFARHSEKPVISGGSGYGATGEHPTQALVDLFTIKEEFGCIDGLKFLLIGELDQRAPRSLVTALSQFSRITIYTHHPDRHGLYTLDIKYAQDRGCEVIVVFDLLDVLPLVDVVYHAGINPQCKFDPTKFLVDLPSAKLLKDHSIILHPLPRSALDVSFDVDDHPSARYFRQSGAGVAMRKAVIKMLLCK